MTRYLLDTDVVINALKGRDPDRAWVLERVRAGDELAVSAVVLAEFYSGLERGADAPADELLDRLPAVPFDRAIALAAGAMRYEHARRGRRLTTTDCLIAATAADSGATLVTRNVRDFPMAGVQVLEPD